MSRNKTVIGSGNVSKETERADNAIRVAGERATELTMIRRRIRTFFSAVTQVSFPANPEAPAWAEDWPQWLETGEIPVKEVEETPVEETPAE